MALRAGYYGLKRVLIKKVKDLPGFSAIGTGLQINNDGELEATGATTTIDPNPEGEATESLEKLQIGETIYGVNDNTKCYQTDDDTEATIVDADYIPFYDASASAPKKSTWSNFVSKIKAKITEYVTWSINSIIGAKNFLNNIAVTSTIGNITFTVGSDKSVTISGTSGEAEYSSLWLNQSVYLEAGVNYKLVGAPEGGGPSPQKWNIQVVPLSSTTSIAADYGSGAEFTVDITGYYRARINTYPSQEYDNLLFKPMIILSDDISTGFADYAMTNRELTENKVDKEMIIIDSSFDLDNVKDTGFYYITSSPSNIPDSLAYTFMDVRKRSANDNVRQIIYGSSTIYIRAYNGTTWSSWYKFIGTIVS